MENFVPVRFSGFSIFVSSLKPVHSLRFLHNFSISYCGFSPLFPTTFPLMSSRHEALLLLLLGFIAD